MVFAEQPQQHWDHHAQLERLDDTAVELSLDGGGVELREVLEHVGVTAEFLEKPFSFNDACKRRLRVLPERREHLVRGNFLTEAHGEPVLKEQVDPRPEETALRNLPAPPVLVEIEPVCARPCVDIGTQGLAFLEQVVLDEICLKQRCAAVVECLEDELVVVRVRQIDRNDLQALLQRRLTAQQAADDAVRSLSLAAAIHSRIDALKNSCA